MAIFGSTDPTHNCAWQDIMGDMRRGSREQHTTDDDEQDDDDDDDSDEDSLHSDSSSDAGEDSRKAGGVRLAD